MRRSSLSLALVLPTHVIRVTTNSDCAQKNRLLQYLDQWVRPSMALSSYRTRTAASRRVFR